MTQTEWDAAKFWLTTYKSGTRITFDGKDFRFWALQWTPRLRVEELGFNKFPVSPATPSPEIMDGVAQHAAYLAEFCKMDVPEKVKDRFCHLLSKDYELQQLQHECIGLGFAVYGLPMDGGIFPVKAEAAKVPESNYVPQPMPEILTNYLRDYANEQA